MNEFFLLHIHIHEQKKLSPNHCLTYVIILTTSASSSLLKDVGIRKHTYIPNSCVPLICVCCREMFQGQWYFSDIFWQLHEFDKRKYIFRNIDCVKPLFNQDVCEQLRDFLGKCCCVLHFTYLCHIYNQMKIFKLIFKAFTFQCQIFLLLWIAFRWSAMSWQ